MTEVSDFFRGRSVFITGGTGYVGKAVVEKLLRSCPTIGTIFLLIRPKKGLNPQERLIHLFTCPIFGPLLEARPDVISKVVPVLGDLMQPELGISVNVQTELQQKVSVVIHSGATVRFSDSMKTCTQINVSGTKCVIQLAANWPLVKAVVHVSTAFCPFPQETIEEKIYDVPIEPERLMQCAEWMSEEQLDCVTASICSDWPNPYSYTKNTAEVLVKQYKDQLPLVIVRPSIVICTKDEPLDGFCDTFVGVGGIMFGGAVGIVRTMPGIKEQALDIIPLDMVVNSIILAAYNVARNPSTDVKVYNVVSSARNPINYDVLEKNARRDLIHDAPFDNAMWYPLMYYQTSRLQFRLIRFLLHSLPAFLFDLWFGITGKPFRLGDIYDKLHLNMDAVWHFMLRDFDFKDANLRDLIATCSPEIRKVYACDVDQIDWSSLCRSYNLGARKYLLKQDPSTIPAARRRMKRLFIAHCAFKLIMFLVFMRILYSMTLGLMSSHDYITANFF
ncbi:putative fatty acyl-CoA reductase CG5065 [Neocloeon triangulifer]|uniref:putative fatty acyl-CoA reductase CG5065 n=1 Tax=Neocloeon triangulifer TaxID=2078957 RepID=UPI00286FA307|nr:putative fatty acyl-CoA reductase CG5065 [Neocloeon triangulifer]